MFDAGYWTDFYLFDLNLRWQTHSLCFVLEVMQSPEGFCFWNLLFCFSVDQIPPEIIFCPADITRTILRGSGQVVVTWQEPSAMDNSGSTPTVTSSHNSGDSFPSTVRTFVAYIFSDSVGNTAVCTFTISITEGKYIYNGGRATGLPNTPPPPPKKKKNALYE